MKLLIRDLCKKYDDVTIIGKASYTFERGRVYGVVGAGKSGKTTFLGCIGREIRADSGSIIIENGGRFDKTDYNDFGFVKGEPILMEYMTGREYVNYCLRIHESEHRAEEYFNMLGMSDDTLDKLIKKYTEGEKQALQMIEIMAVNPPVILMDEPFGDDKGIAAEEFIKVMKQERIIILTADSVDRVRDICDEVLVVNHGIIEGYDRKALCDNEILEHIKSITKESGDKADA